jgi:SagB-type dehydrogenase family enzyme
VYHYVPVHHGLEQLRDEALPRRFQTYLFMGQRWATEAGAVVVITAVPGRSLWKYGDRGYRYFLLEAGHAMQNLNLAAIAVGLGSCNLGGFFDDELAAVVRADVEEEFPLYAAAVGVPATRDRHEQRSIEE